MATNSVTGRFRDIEISFTADGPQTIMNVQNLLSQERSVRVMYKKLSISGLANWTQFQLTDKCLSFLVPIEVIQAYRLTFFVDDSDPVSTRLEKVLEELEPLRNKSRTHSAPQVSAPVPATCPVGEISGSRGPSNVNVPPAPNKPVTQQVGEISGSREETLAAAAPSQKPLLVGAVSNRAIAEELQPTQTVQPTVPPQAAPALKVGAISESRQEALTPESTTPKGPIQLAGPSFEFKITVSSLPQSYAKVRVRAEQEGANAKLTKRKTKQPGVFGQFARALGLSAGRRRGKAYHRQQSERVQYEFQDRLAKLETDYSEGCGLKLIGWDPAQLSEAETAIFILNLMETEIVAWRKEAGRATPKSQLLVDTLAEVDVILKQTLKQIRGVSAPSPTRLPDVIVENWQDLEKIQGDCEAYLRRFLIKLTELEKKHAAKVEVLPFKKFLSEFVRDLLFVNVAKSIKPYALPPRLNWFLELINAVVIPIEVGKTKVSLKYHTVQETRESDFESGTIIEVITPGLQSKEGEQVRQKTVVILAE